MAYILALDQGTTSSRAILFDQSGAIAAVAQQEFEQFYPRAGWVEHDPTEILTSQLACAVEALGRAGALPKDVAAIGIANQRETGNRQGDLSSHRLAGPADCRAVRHPG